MNNRDRTVVGKVLDEIAIAESLMQNEDLASFLEDEKLKRAVCMTVINIGELVKNSYRELSPYTRPGALESHCRLFAT